MEKIFPQLAGQASPPLTSFTELVMHRSWPLLSLAFIVLISLSSVCTLSVESRGLPLKDMDTSSLSSGTITIKWKERSRPVVSPDREEPDAIRAKLPLAKRKIHRLTSAAENVLGLDIIPGKPLTINYDSGSSFESAYGYGFVKFLIIGGKKSEGKHVEGLIYLGSTEYTQRLYELGRIYFGDDQVFPEKKS
ncbi:hypothetical protein F5050DRAFT_1781633 [Lentinula boryana]|uniref:Uncharacterized protein n=1 Tax=Lentinula boryana TaxID=40481 RepID=A0ABQ8Q435_9AGAR|nr:hypothetical protein F5050DRAFT_1781633 [Lentinula boryana]